MFSYWGIILNFGTLYSLWWFFFFLLKSLLISDFSFYYIPTSLSKYFQPECQSKLANYLFLMSEFP